MIEGPFALRDYALLADGERGALVDPAGSIAWMCAPGWSDPAIFSELLGGRSTFAITPVGRFTWGGFYEPGSLIWRSRWITEGATVESREALALPADGDRLVLLRRVEVLEGSARLQVTLRPRADFDRHGPRQLRLGDDGVWRWHCGSLAMSAAGLAEAQAGDGLHHELTLERGARHDIVLEVGGRPSAVRAPEELWEATEAGWAERVPELSGTLAPRDARHAVAVMAGLSSASGAMVAAATMSLPERARHGRSYDYRYAWIRDLCYAGQAAAAAEVPALLDGAVHFVTARLASDGPQLMPAYTVGGGPVPEEHHVGLPGYPGGSDVCGNRVRDQFQLDAFGEALLLLAAAAERDRLDPDGWEAAEIAVRTIASRWEESDAGVWEIEPRWWTHSRLTCAAGLRAIARHSPGGTQTARWSALADTLLAACSARAQHPSGRWQRAGDDPRPDAALLLGALRGALPPDDPRSVATLEAIVADLGEEGYVYRFRPDGRPLGSAEGAFLLCGFWLALACLQAGRRREAAHWFERSRSACGSPGLLSEEFDVTQRQLRGNLPQAFVHALLLESAARLS